jgi:hypothetical protein
MVFPRTLVQGGRQQCAIPGCTGFKMIECGPPPSLAAAIRYAAPAIDGVRADWCGLWGEDCGQGGADAFCRAQGHGRALAWGYAPAPRTVVLAKRQVCASDRGACVGLSDVACQPRN